jgi:hypothetical protein
LAFYSHNSSAGGDARSEEKVVPDGTPLDLLEFDDLVQASNAFTGHGAA